MKRLLCSLQPLPSNGKHKPGMRPGRRGQSLVEFALLIPVFLLFAVVVFDLGRAVYYYSAVHNAAREGARYGVVSPNDFNGMRNRAVEYAVGLGMVVANVTAGPGTPQVVDGFPNPTVKVTVTYAFIPATPLLANFLPGGQITLRGEAVMRTESLPSP